MAQQTLIGKTKTKALNPKNLMDAEGNSAGEFPFTIRKLKDSDFALAIMDTGRQFPQFKLGLTAPSGEEYDLLYLFDNHLASVAEKYGEIKTLEDSKAWIGKEVIISAKMVEKKNGMFPEVSVKA
jgi:hypothetical protein